MRCFSGCARIVPLVLLLLYAVPAVAEPLASLVDIQGVRGNQLIGYSLVVGLDGTGDKNQVKFTNQTLTNMLRQFGVQLPNKIDPKVKNVAAVAVSATLPPCTPGGSALTLRSPLLATRKACAAARCY